MCLKHLSDLVQMLTYYVLISHISERMFSCCCKNIREYCESLGADIYFRHKMKDIEIENKHVRSITIYDSSSGKEFTRKCKNVCLAIGHSARDTFAMLYDKKIIMEPKAFAVGLRIMHPQEFINNNAYGNNIYNLPAADYKVTYKSVCTGRERGVYSFCMCPGGYVVNASSEKNMLAVNGMSYSGRDSSNANSAMIVTVTPEDYGYGLLMVLSFKENWKLLHILLVKEKYPYSFLAISRKIQHQHHLVQ